MNKIAVFVSGSGSNAERIAEYFRERKTAEVSLLLSNRPDAYALRRAERLGIESVVFDRDDFYRNGRIERILSEKGIDYLVLAGFLWFVPASLTSRYNGRILNIHPSLLPKFGGKGMYGEHVHRAVIESGEQESGITIHRVNELYDSGDVVFQARIPVLPNDTPEGLASRIHELEYRHFPVVIEKEILRNSTP